MAPLYKKALIIGATSGIGAALAAKLAETGTFVVAAGRRRERLDSFVAAHPGSAAAFAVDISELSSIPAFAAAVLRAHPDLDCVVVNAGVQRGLSFASGAPVDLAAFDEELRTNYSAAVHVTAAFAPHLQALAARGGADAHLVFVGASLALVPSLLMTPGYCASKAALHAFVTVLRQQLRGDDDDGHHPGVRVVEVFPPAVQTELHDTRHQPQLVDGGQIGMPLPAFTERMLEGLRRGDAMFAVGPGSPRAASRISGRSSSSSSTPSCPACWRNT